MAEIEDNAQETEIRDTDIAFDCPHCGKNLVIDYRGAGLEIKCSACVQPSCLLSFPVFLQTHTGQLIRLEIHPS